MKERLKRLLAEEGGGSFTFLCGACLNGESAQMNCKHKTANHCVSPKHHPWTTSRIMVCVSGRSGRAPRQVRPKPKGLMSQASMCWHKKAVCQWESKCKFAHNEIEKKIWDLGNVNYDMIVKQWSKSQPSERFCCMYCDRSFLNQTTLERHINTNEHKTKITSDKDRPWQYRDPPPNVVNGIYTICAFANGGTCGFSNADPMDNPCPKAHSKAELTEWKNRHEYRKMKMKKANMQGLFSCMDDLLTEYNFSLSEGDVMSENDQRGITVQCNQELRQCIEGKANTAAGGHPNTVVWKFVINTSEQIQLKRVGLLHDSYRVHFYLSSPKNSTKPQICPGKVIERTQAGHDHQYHVNVIFESRMLGSYKQWVFFDCGKKPVLIRKLCVSIGDQQRCYLPDESIVSTTMWNSRDYHVVRYCNSTDDTVPNLEAMYKLTEFHPEIKRDECSLSMGNYRHVMHHMLRLEEAEYMDKLSSFSTETKLQVTNAITIDSLRGTAVLYAQSSDDLFGEIDITKPIFGDSEASQIALTNVCFVLLKFKTNSTKPTIYEAKVVDEEGGETKDKIYVRLSSQCITDQQLVDKCTADVELQFCVDRLHFCRMHRAIDNLVNLDVVFPSKNPHPALICADPSEDNDRINRRQKGAVRFIESTWGRQRNRMDKPEVLLVYGPFGTGKTYTLANAVMQTLRSCQQGHDQARFLICTHVNSAADLYITDFFDQFVENNKRFKLRRIVATMREKSRIPEVVRKYVVFDTNDTTTPKKLEVTDVFGCQIVITTTITATQLVDLPKLKNYFTHILIDEAGQILEPECIIPLALVNAGTCVVLAGDHLQMSPKVYSTAARDIHLNKSLLERLFEHCLQKKCRREILLDSNYRTCPEILAFLSKNFYTAVDIEPCGNQPPHPVWFPLEFRAVMGDEQSIGNSYVNVYEVLEIGNRVAEILSQWPSSWGPVSPQEIGVLTPYRLQVQLIRNQLRKQKLQGVFVDRLQGVQGKQFRVVIVSTVRTLTSSNDSRDYLGFMSDFRELNTALTRARSLVIVAGNPFALCSVGNCCNVWRRYIKECESKSSLYPEDMTYTAIHSVIGRPGQSMLNPDARSFAPVMSSRSPKVTPFDDDTTSDLTERSSDNSSDSEDDDYQVNQDDIILRALHQQRSLDLGESGQSFDVDDSIPLAVEEENGDVVFVRETTTGRPQDEIQEQGDTVTCTFRINREGKYYAIPKETIKDCDEIVISNKTHRGTALDGDVVAVQLLDNPDGSPDEAPANVYGKVLQVKESATDMQSKKVVCRANAFSDRLMVPLERHLPPLYVLRPNQTQRRSDGGLTVQICGFGRNRVKVIKQVEVSHNDRPHMLFLVKWLKWDAGFGYPLGMVTDCLPQGDNLEDGLFILKQIYNVTESECDIDEEYPEDWVIPDEEITNRTDLRHHAIFTIDPPESEDLDDALSKHVHRHPNSYRDI